MRLKHLSTLALCATLGLLTKPAFAQDRMDERELAAVRGGFITANGVTFGFGATVQTYVNGALVLQSSLTLTDTGLVKKGGQSATVAGDGGLTTVQSGVTSSQIFSLVSNTANNQVIRQKMQVDIALPGFAAAQRSAAAQQLSGALQSAVGFGLATSGAR